jgi:hypothetical protein
MLDNYHSQLERQLRDLRFDVHDRFDDRNHPTARLIHNELQKAEDMAQGGHNLRSIEDKLKIVQRQMEQDQRLQPHERVMNTDHSEAFFHQMERMRQDMRRHPHY